MSLRLNILREKKKYQALEGGKSWPYFNTLNEVFKHVKGRLTEREFYLCRSVCSIGALEKPSVLSAVVCIRPSLWVT